MAKKKIAKSTRTTRVPKPARKTAKRVRRAAPAARARARRPSRRTPPSVSGERAVIRTGGPPTIFTIGYQGRDGDEVVELLLAAGVEHLADIRAKPMSRNPEFRAGPLRRRCEAAGIEYGPWQSLGTPDEIRLRVKATRNYPEFHRAVRENAVETMQEPLADLGEIARSRRVALLCLERAHEECHRADIAELLADRIGAGIVAIV